jgi:hypothetical protein
MVTPKNVPWRDQVLTTVKPGELWIADRNMCTVAFLFGLHRSGASFVIREHKSMPWEAVNALQSFGCVETGDLFEQTVRLADAQESLLVRRVVLKLKKPTRNREKEIAIFTYLPPDVATPAVVAELYRGRRSALKPFSDGYGKLSVRDSNLRLSQSSIIFFLPGVGYVQHFGNGPRCFS